VQLIKSLFCFNGYDNKQRFAVINTAAYLVLLLNQLLFAESIGFQLLLAVVLLALVLMSALRRSKDSNSLIYYSAIFAVTFVIVALAMLVIDHWAKYLLLLPAAIVTAMGSLLASSNPERQYHMGYCGPVELKPGKGASSPKYSQRIEPTITGHENQPTANTEYHYASAVYQQVQQSSVESETVSSPVNAIQQWLADNTRLALGLTSALTLLIFASILALVFFKDVPQQAPENKQVTASAAQPERLHQLAMPDDFYLIMDANQGVIIHWQADDNDNGEIWSQASATGDKTCSHIAFDNKNQLRTMAVSVEKSSDYFAAFSPLDTAKLVKLLAAKSRFKLCGYDFSLQGSQAKLSYDKVFEAYL
jgi:hypothetical protein